MGTFSGTRGFAAALALVLLLGLPAVVSAADTTPPTGSAVFWDVHHADETIEFRFSFSDPESGLASIAISCDGGPEASYPYATKLIMPGMDPAAGGCTTFGSHTFTARVTNGDGLFATVLVAAWTVPVVRFEYPLIPRTGEPFTIRPVYSSGFLPPPDAHCRWEFRWGSTSALRDNVADETFGGLLFEGSAADGFCGEWTFTLPWVPFPQFEVSFDGPAALARSGSWPDRELIHAEVAGTERRILESNLPIAQVLPSTYSPVVGRPVTYTRYLIGGATACCKARWSARLGNSQTPITWEEWTTSPTFTITPPRSGPLAVGWDRDDSGNLLAGYYDPPVRHADRTRPNTSAPVARIGTGEVDGTVPVKLTWSGTDVGWGIGSYKLQQSTNGGPWHTVTLPRPKATSITRHLAPNTAYRFRVRAIDKAGNRGAWDYGPTFRAKTVSEASAKVAYPKSWTVDPDPTAYGGALTESIVFGARATYTFRGRDIAWLAERGPGHGKAKVYVDGRLIGVVDLEAASDQPRRIVFTRHWSSVGSHTIRIVVSGTAGRPVVSVVGFIRLR